MPTPPASAALRQPPPRLLPPLALITTFGLGRVRPAPGTWGSLPPVFVAFGLILAGATPGSIHSWAWHLLFGLLVLVFVAACLREGDLAEAVYYQKDPSPVVADETAAMSLFLLLLPAAPFASPLLGVLTVVYAFVCFRVLDILKLWPAHGLQSLRGGPGILLDDLVAAIQGVVLVWTLVLIAL